MSGLLSGETSWPGIGLTLLLGLGALLLIQGLSRPIGRALSRSTRPEEQIRQLRTLLLTARWTLSLLVITLLTLTLLSRWFNIQPLLASLGVLGLALSLGAQSLARDFLSGLTILLENQFNVGDTIRTNGITGEVERLTLRATWLRDADGLLHTIPNGEIRTVANASRDWARATVTVELAGDADGSRAVAALTAAIQAVAQAPDLHAVLLEPPQLLGPLPGRGTIGFTLTARTQPGQQIRLQRALQVAALQQLAQAGLSLSPRQEIVLLQPEKSPPGDSSLTA